MTAKYTAGRAEILKGSGNIYVDKMSGMANVLFRITHRAETTHTNTGIIPSVQCNRTGFYIEDKGLCVK